MSAIMETSNDRIPEHLLDNIIGIGGEQGLSFYDSSVRPDAEKFILEVKRRRDREQAHARQSRKG